MVLSPELLEPPPLLELLSQPNKQVETNESTATAVRVRFIEGPSRGFMCT